MESHVQLHVIIVVDRLLTDPETRALLLLILTLFLVETLVLLRYLQRYNRCEIVVWIPIRFVFFFIVVIVFVQQVLIYFICRNRYRSSRNDDQRRTTWATQRQRIEEIQLIGHQCTCIREFSDATYFLRLLRTDGFRVAFQFITPFGVCTWIVRSSVLRFQQRLLLLLLRLVVELVLLAQRFFCRSNSTCSWFNWSICER